jgi:hypothetical protein
MAGNHADNPQKGRMMSTVAYKPKPAGKELTIEMLDIRTFQAIDGVTYVVFRIGNRIHTFVECEAKNAYDHIVGNAPDTTKNQGLTTHQVWHRLWRE